MPKRKPVLPDFDAPFTDYINPVDPTVRKGPKRERVDGKTTAKIFKALRNGTKLSDIIVRYKVSPRMAQVLRAKFRAFEDEGKPPPPPAEAPLAPEKEKGENLYEASVEDMVDMGDDGITEQLRVRLVVSLDWGTKPSRTFDLATEWYDAASPEGLCILSTQRKDTPDASDE